WNFPSGAFEIHQTSGSSSQTQVPRVVEIRLDALSYLKSEPVDASAICAAPGPDPQSKPVWNGWVSFEGSQVPAKSNDERIRVCGRRMGAGAAVLIANQSESRIELKVDAKLPAGVYSIERLGFDLGKQESPPKLERLSGKLLKSRTSIKKPGWLLPGTASIY